MSLRKWTQNVSEHDVVVFDKSEAANSFSVSAEIKGETVGCTFPKSDKWLDDYKGVPGYIWKLRKLYEDKYVKDSSEDIKLGRY